MEHPYSSKCICADCEDYRKTQTQTAELRDAWEKAYFAYASAGESIENCKEFAALTITAWPAMTAERDAIIAKAVQE